MIKDNVQIIGMGQCGGRIGKEFENVGLDVTYVNSDEIDMRGLSISEKKKLLIATTGTGGSPLKGKEILEANHDKFAKFMTEHMDPNKLQMFVVGGGGGTGGGFVCPAVKLAKERGFKVGVIYTLPLKMSGPLAAENCFKTLKSLKQIELNTFIIADNELLINKIGISAEWWTKVNQAIVQNVISVYDVIRPGKTTNGGFGSIDKGEVLRIMQSGKGETDVRTFYLNPSDFKLDDKDLMLKLFDPILVEGFDYKTTLSYLVSVDVPIKGTWTEEANRIFTLTKKMCGSSLSRPGMFIDPTLATGQIRVTMVNAGLKLPKVIQSRMNNLKRDEVRYKGKINKSEKINLDEPGEGFMNEDFDF